MALLLLGCLSTTTQPTAKTNQTQQGTPDPTGAMATTSAIQATVNPSTNAPEPTVKSEPEKPTPTTWGTVQNGAYITQPFVKSYDKNPDKLTDSSKMKKIDWQSLFQCDEVFYDLDTGGLKPQLPLARCTGHAEWGNLDCDSINDGDPKEIAKRECETKNDEIKEANEKKIEEQGVIFVYGGPLGGPYIYYRFVTLHNGQPRMIYNVSQFQEIFSPVESPAEAVAFAVLIGSGNDFADSEAKFVTGSTGYRWLVSLVNGTHAETVPGGYIVNLFDTFPGDCDEQIIQKNMFVAKNGSLEFRERLILAERVGGPTMCA